MLVSATAGYLRRKLAPIWRLRSLRAKTSVLAVIFLLVPVFLYAEFRKAYQDSQDLLLQSVRDQVGRRGVCPGLWVLVAADEQHELPVIDNREVPLISSGQRARVPLAWLENQHRSDVHDPDGLLR